MTECKTGRRLVNSRWTVFNWSTRVFDEGDQTGLQDSSKGHTYVIKALIRTFMSLHKKNNAISPSL